MLQTIQSQILAFKPPIPSTPFNTNPKLHADTHNTRKLSPKKLKMWAQKRSKCYYIYIYIYMAVGSFAAANFVILGIFPNFIVKNGEKEMLQNLPHLSFYVFGETKKGLGLQSQASFEKKIGTAVPGLFLGSFGFQSDAFLLIWQKNL